MASIETLRNPDGSIRGYRARWRDPDGHSRRKAFKTKRDASAFLVTTEHAKATGAYVPPAAGRITLGEWLPTWQATLGGLKDSTRHRYLQLARVHVEPRFGRRRLDRIAPSDVAAWITDLSDAGAGAGTVRQAHRVLSLVLDLAVRDGRLARNPATKAPLPKAERRAPRFLSADQLAALVEAAGAGWLLVRLLGLTGLRFGEAAGLRVWSVDLLRGRLSISETVTEVGGRLVWTTPKDHEARSVPLPKSLRGPMAEMLAGRAQDDLVFTAAKGGTLRLRNWRREVFNPAAKAAGVEWATPHTLRHTAASLAIASGADPKAVQRMLGHASAAMTMDIYAGLWQDGLDDVADRLDGLVPFSCPPGQVVDLAKRRKAL
jgi:integrase